MKSHLDPRLVPATDTTASAALEGVIAAPAYQNPEALQATTPRVAIQKAPFVDAEQLNELVFGEAFEVLERRDDFVFGQALRDGYVGWVEGSALGEPGPSPTHRIAALATFAFLEPSIKAPVVHRLSMNVLGAVEAQEGRFRKLHGSGWVVEDHLSPIGCFVDDPAAVALSFMGAPYLWGGRSSDGLDCSGLVQQALYACGRACPRDSDQQMTLGAALDMEAPTGRLQRNDLVFWPGHVGVMVNGAELLHANAFAMCVALEPLETAIARIKKAGAGAPRGYRRL